MCPQWLFSYYYATTAQKLVVTLTWFSFVLIHSYYSGALVMFFATEPSLPFSTLEEVLTLYPTWKLKMLRGMQVDFVGKKERGEALFVEFWNRMESKPSEAVLSNLDEAFAQIRSDQVVMYAAYLQLRGYLKNNPQENQNVNVFYKSKKKYSTMILPKNSPLTPFLTQAALKIIEGGGMDYLTHFWIGPEVTSSSETETVVLAGSQLVLCYIVVTIMGGASFLVFIGELLSKKFSARKKKKSVLKKIKF